MIRPKRFPKIRFYNLHKLGYRLYWHNWTCIKFNITPTFERRWNNQIINIGIMGIGLSLDFRRGNMIDQMIADDIVRDLPKN